MSDQLLQELLVWTRIMAADSFRDLLRVHLRTELDWIVFEGTDGTRNREQAGALVGITGRAVGTKWAAWREAGLIVTRPEFEYPCHIASATSVGFLKPIKSEVNG